MQFDLKKENYLQVKKTNSPEESRKFKGTFFDQNEYD
jgi:hypothetical protein